MHHGRADFTCLTLGTSNTLYVFGGTGSETHDKYIEKYESIIDVWTTIKYKVPLSLLSKGNQILMLSPSNDSQFMLLNTTSKEPKDSFI